MEKKSVGEELEEQRCLIEKQQREIDRQRHHIEMQRRHIYIIRAELDAIHDTLQTAAPILRAKNGNGHGNGNHRAARLPKSGTTSAIRR